MTSRAECEEELRRLQELVSLHTLTLVHRTPCPISPILTPLRPQDVVFHRCRLKGAELEYWKMQRGLGAGHIQALADQGSSVYEMSIIDRGTRCTVVGCFVTPADQRGSKQFSLITLQHYRGRGFATMLMKLVVNQELKSAACLQLTARVVNKKVAYILGRLRNALYETEYNSQLSFGRIYLRSQHSVPTPDSDAFDEEGEVGGQQFENTAVPDAGEPDAGEPDAGEPDLGVPDAGGPDAGEPDLGVPDTGGPDAGEPDLGVPDTGGPDAGEPDAGGPVPSLALGPATPHHNNEQADPPLTCSNLSPIVALPTVTMGSPDLPRERPSLSSPSSGDAHTFPRSSVIFLTGKRGGRLCDFPGLQYALDFVESSEVVSGPLETDSLIFHGGRELLGIDLAVVFREICSTQQPGSCLINGHFNLVTGYRTFAKVRVRGFPKASHVVRISQDVIVPGERGQSMIQNHNRKTRAILQEHFARTKYIFIEPNVSNHYNRAYDDGFVCDFGAKYKRVDWRETGISTKTMEQYRKIYCAGVAWPTLCFEVDNLDVAPLGRPRLKRKKFGM
jgi:GNAT superfamily N-acetyltransferase